MRLYSENENYKLYQGNMLDMLEVIEPNSIDSIVTDPPYGLTSITKRFDKENSVECQYGKDGSFQRLSKGFMGKEWDGSGIEYNIDAWRKCYEILKPGGYLLAFGGSRTFHRIACAIEDAGFEIRDTICWMYGSGFPKSMNVGLAIDKKNGVESKIIGSKIRKQDFNNPNEIEQKCGFKKGIYEIKEAQNKWQGWGTALKPSFEPIIVARKPFKGSLVDNVIEYGVGGINIDECRVGNEIITQLQKDMTKYHGNKLGTGHHTQMTGITTQTVGRFPANTILTYDETDFDEVCGGFPYTKTGWKNNDKTKTKDNIVVDFMNKVGFTGNHYEDSGSASRYFYNAKASKKDRDEGLDEFETKQCVGGGGGIGNYLEDVNSASGKFGSEKAPHKNTHPTVKPTELMQYLVRLVTPNGGTVLDPFNGSGSTGKAVMYENHERDKNYKYVGIELTEEYLPISKARIEYVCNLPKEQKQSTIFDYLGDDNNE